MYGTKQNYILRSHPHGLETFAFITHHTINNLTVTESILNYHSKVASYTASTSNRYL